MRKIPEEYILLFNAVTDAEETLKALRARLVAAQRRTEEMFMEDSGSEGEAPSP